MARFIGRVLRLLILLLSLTVLRGADALPPVEALVRASLLPAGMAAPGGTVAVVVRFDLAPHWHLYWTNPGDSGMPPSLAWTLPAGWTAGEPRFPVPERLVEAGLVSFAYHDRLDLLVDLRLPADAADGEAEISVVADYLVCKEACIPGTATAASRITIAATGVADAALLAEVRQRQAVAPEAAGLRLTASAEAGAVLLTVAGSDLPAPPEAPFVPRDEGRFELAPAQVVAADASAWRLRLPLAQGQAAPERLAGFLLGLPGVAGVAVDTGLDAGPPVVPAPGPGLFTALIAGLIGGLILNLMPCVLPVLALKVLSAASARAAGRSLVGPSLGFAAGVIATFLALAVLLLVLRAGGAQLGWGFQLQEPAVVLAIAFLFTALTLNLGGLFEIGLSATRVDVRRGGSFWNGVLTTIVATPCGAPFVSAALAFAVVAPPVEALAVFASLGVGLAAPVVLLSLLPGAARMMPKPGAWMDDLKRVLAVPMLGAAGWMLWTFSAQVDGEASLAVFAVAVPALALAAGAWGRYQAAASRTALGVALAGMALVLAVGWWAVQRPPVPTGAETSTTALWQPWSATREAELRAAGTPYLIDFTAAWCLTCQANKRTALHRDEVITALDERGVVRLRADFTNRDSEVALALGRRNRASVPTYVLHHGDGRESILPDLLTIGIVLDAISDIPRRNP